LRKLKKTREKKKCKQLGKKINKKRNEIEKVKKITKYREQILAHSTHLLKLEEIQKITKNLGTFK
jgi:hypothetical protein